MTRPVGVTTYYRNVNSELAQQWLDQYLFDRQRRVRPHHVTQLAQAMRQGLFREGTPLSFALLNGTRILVNGQHTLHALIAAGATLRLAIEEHEIKNQDELAKLYLTFDTHMRRTGSDFVNAYDFGKTHGLSSNMIDALSGAIPILVGGFLGVTRGKDHPVNIFMSNPHNKLAAMDLWATPARAYCEMFAHNVPAYIKWQAHRAMVAAVGILTFRYQPVAAKEFWERIARRENLTSGMPEYRLVHYLAPPQESGLRQGFAYSRGVAAAWNAAFHGRTLNRGIVPRRSDKPMLIAGTPFDGKREIMFCTVDANKQVQLSWSPVEVVRDTPPAE